MLRFKWLNAPLVALAVFSLFSCGKDLPTLDGINKEAWTADRNGCTNVRREMTQAIRNEREKLLALDEIQIVKLLGRPDRNELFKRNQKFYYYFLEPSADCNGVNSKKPLTLIIRFNAMGLAKEVVIE